MYNTLSVTEEKMRSGQEWPNLPNSIATLMLLKSSSPAAFLT